MIDKDGKDLQVGDKVLVEMEVADENKLPLDIRLEWHGKDKPSLAFNAAACHISKVGESAPAVEEEESVDASILDGTVKDIIDLIPAMTTAAEVEALIAEEEAGKNRSTVLKALRDKLATFPK